ncbi:MAG TPA: SUMF1/EgtB/PvdO family nonheme iron enzyme, partial [Bacteroidales bacterium]|nr:SUMF1/EgtB/PvdO family nonheme iron enzyme [Bacteroidales bacterium]
MKNYFWLFFFFLVAISYSTLCHASTTVLTSTLLKHTIASGNDEQVYGTSTSNQIILESGARAELFHFPGQNRIQIQSRSDLFIVYRSGTVVTFQGSDGSILKIPATKDPQTVSFNGEASRVLQIHNNRVMIDDQEITAKPSGIVNTVSQVAGMEFVYVENGCYDMGCGAWADSCDDEETPVHEVCVDGFQMARYEVTVDQYREFLLATGDETGIDLDGEHCPVNNDNIYSLSGNNFGANGDQPMVAVNWNGAAAFADWLSDETGFIFRLPTE